MNRDFIFSNIQHVIVGGVKTACLSRSELTEFMIIDCLYRRDKNEDPALIFSSNGQALSLAAFNKSFRDDLEQAEIIHADGGAVVAAANVLTNGTIGDRSATTDFIHDAAVASIKNNLTFYLLGGEESVNLATIIKLQKIYPGLKIVGRRNGYFEPNEEKEICAEISRLKPDIVWVGLGKPKEQRFCVEHRSDINAGWLITCGGCYNFITGDYSRAPLWMQNYGLEWLHRMCTNPYRLLWRYITTNPHALFLLLTKTQKKKIV